jgi:S1-C subfamily serine protease
LGVSIQPLDAELAASFGLDRVTGALVTRVLHGTPAEKAGLQRGDVLLSFDGKPVRSVKELQLLVASSPLGKDLPVEVLRERVRLTLTVTIVARDAETQSTEQEIVEDETPWLGMSFDETEQGIRVAAVELDSIAANAGVQVGDLILAINRRAVKNLADLHAARQRGRVKEGVLLLLQRGETSLYVVLPLKK